MLMLRCLLLGASRVFSIRHRVVTATTVAAVLVNSSCFWLPHSVCGAFTASTLTTTITASTTFRQGRCCDFAWPLVATTTRCFSTKRQSNDSSESTAANSGGGDTDGIAQESRSASLLPPLSSGWTSGSSKNKQVQEAIAWLEENQNKNDNYKARIQITPHAHGYRVFPFTWSELQEIIAPPSPAITNPKENDKHNNNDQVITVDRLSYLSRSIPQQYEYELYKIFLRQTWRSVSDHVLCSKFGFPSQIDPGSNKYQAAVTLEDAVLGSYATRGAAAKPKLALVPNEFPYFVEEPIQHFVLWKLGTIPCTQDEIAWAKQELPQRIMLLQPEQGETVDKQEYEFLYWTNPPHLQSIREIHHAHILCRPVNDH